MLGLFAGAYWGPRAIGSGVSVTPAFDPIVMEKGERYTYQVEVLEGGAARDCTGYTAKLGVKEALTDTTYKIGPLDGVFSENEDGVLSILTFIVTPDLTKAMARFSGLYSVAIYDSSNNKIVLSDRGGVRFTLLEDTLDVA